MPLPIKAKKLRKDDPRRTKVRKGNTLAKIQEDEIVNNISYQNDEEILLPTFHTSSSDYVVDSNNNKDNSIDNPKPSGIFPLWSKFTERIHKCVLYGVVKLSVAAAKHPRKTIAIVPTISLILIAAGFFTNFVFISNQFELYGPFNSLPVQLREWMLQEDLRGNKDREEPRFDIGAPLTMIIHDSDSTARNPNLVSKNTFRKAFQMINAIRELPDYNDVCSQGTYTEPWSSGSTTTCQIQSVTRFWQHNETLFQESIKTDEDLRAFLSSATTPDGTPIDFSYYMGDIEFDYDIDNDDGVPTRTIRSARALFFYITLIRTDKTPELETQALDAIMGLRNEWQEEVIVVQDDETGEYSLQYNTISVEIMAARSIADELLVAVFRDLPLMPICFGLMSMFTCFNFLFVGYQPKQQASASTNRMKRFLSTFDPVQTRYMLGIGSVLTITFSIVSGCGLMFLIGIPYTNMTSILPFIMFGIGLDDTFIITGHYFRIRGGNNIDPVEKLKDTISTIGMSIFVTTLTTSLAFMLGLISNIPAVYWLCLYAFPMIIIDFLYQVTFFVALLVLDDRRIQEGRKEFIFFWWPDSNSSIEKNSITDDDEEDHHHHQQQQTIKKSKSDPKQQRNQKDGDDDKDDDVDDNTNIMMENDIPSSGQESRTKGSSNHSEINTTATSATTKCTNDMTTKSLSLQNKVMTRFGQVLLENTALKFSIVFLFTAYFCFCIYSTTLMRQEFNPIDLVPETSYVKTFFEIMNRYNSNKLPVEVVFRNVNQSDPMIQEEMLDYIDDITSLERYFTIPEDDSTIATTNNGLLLEQQQPNPAQFCWIQDFRDYIDNNEGIQVLLAGANTFTEKVDRLLSIPDFKDLYGSNIVRDSNNEIVASRCYITLFNYDLDDVHDSIDWLNDQRRITLQQRINEHYDDNNNDEIEGEEKVELSFFTYNELYVLFEFYNVHIEEFISTTIAGLVGITFVILLFLPHWSAIFFALPLMIVLYIDLIGTIQFVGIRMNVITYVSLMISMGLYIDFIMHVLLRYYESKGRTKEEKVIDSLETLGSSILVGGFSTFLGVSILAASTSTVMQNIYVCFFSMIILGCSHGLILLPVLLLLFGPLGTKK